MQGTRKQKARRSVKNIWPQGFVSVESRRYLLLLKGGGLGGLLKGQGLGKASPSGPFVGSRVPCLDHPQHR